MRARMSRRVPRGPVMRAIVTGMLGVVVLLVLGACEDTKIIEVERPFFEDPPAQAAGFLGYSDEARKLTVCGNCHIGQQGAWEGTAHADAWATLQAAGGGQPFCETCHAVSQSGNATSGDGGWPATQDVRYQDVQCENCHGPGEIHVSNPDASQPLASAAIRIENGGTEGALIAAQADNGGCGECHSGDHHPFVEEWAQSPHAMIVGFAADREECASCHRGQGTLEAWGENADYIEKDGPALPVTCAVCHDPHGSPNAKQLRFPINTTSIENHLCARCHNRRTIPDPNSSHGLEPHSPESALLVGDAGWFPPNSNIDQGTIRGTHGSAANPTLCARCHLPSFEISDQLTGEFVFNSTGHLFRPIPCTDAAGIPLPFQDDCELTVSARSFQACTGGACHGSEEAAFSAVTAATTRIQRLVDELEELLEEVDPNLDGPGGAIDAANPTFTVAEGAFFNLELAQFGNATFGTDNILGSTVHNPFLVEALLIASINAVEEEFGVQANVAADWDAELRDVLQRAGR